ncbi:MAG: hypothetical protein AB7G28_07890 [Pirellulales bacterium]
MKTIAGKRLRLEGKNRAKLPRPKLKHDKGFSLRTIDEADGRFALVKRMQRHLQRLKDDAAIDNIQKEMLAGRAVMICSYLESMEIELIEGKKINFGRYVQFVNALSNILSKLGIDGDAKRSMLTLEQYVASKKGKK